MLDPRPIDGDAIAAFDQVRAEAMESLRRARRMVIMMVDTPTGDLAVHAYVMVPQDDVDSDVVIKMALRGLAKTLLEASGEVGE